MGGDPGKPMVGDPSARPGEPGFAQLGPRKSFDAWAQEVRGRCRPWLDAEVAAARKLAAAVPELLLSCARDRLADLAVHDSLTGLPNRFLLLDRVEQALNGPHLKGRRAALLFIDLDRFKLINDTLGHAAGDALLCQAAERLTLATRDGDTVARLGGDEFVVLCDAIIPAQAERLAQRIVQAFQAPFVVAGNEAAVTASVGVVIAEIGATAADLLHDADTAMYRAKRGGRNAATPFTPEMRMSAHRHVEIESGLGPALDRGDLRLHYQPIYTTSNALTGFEALARWSIPGRGAIAPNEFIPIAEATGAITRLTTWALDEGLRKLASWRRERAQSDLTLSVNISASQITPALQGVVGGALARHGVPPSALRLEITEVALVNDHEVNRRLLGDLRALGVQLSIDDFGTGFSSLAYLVQLPVDEIKIDRFFISGLPARQTDTTVVASVVALAHQLGLRAVAEGVETEAQLSAVRRLGCDLVQGYLLGRPTDSDGVDHLLAPLAGLEAA
jgi:diguanylate cyclase (GGDEF)-like protein